MYITMWHFDQRDWARLMEYKSAKSINICTYCKKISSRQVAFVPAARVSTSVVSAGEVRIAALGTSFVLPLLLGPVVALLLTVAVYPLFRWARRRSGVTSQTCIRQSDGAGKDHSDDPAGLGHDPADRRGPGRRHLPGVGE